VISRPVPPIIRPVGAGALASGHVVRVTVRGHPEFSGDWVVNRRGELDIPFEGAFMAGDFTGDVFSGRIGSVLGKTPRELARIIAGRLSPFLRRSPGVTVEILGQDGG
jgi:protein involved in polysaccharide export with SLBB domain